MRRTARQLLKDAERHEEELKRQQEEARLADIERREEAIWAAIGDHLGRTHRRLREPVALLVQLKELAAARGRVAAFSERLRPIVEGNQRSPSFMRELRAVGLA